MIIGEYDNQKINVITLHQPAAAIENSKKEFIKFVKFIEYFYFRKFTLNFRVGMEA